MKFYREIHRKHGVCREQSVPSLEVNHLIDSLFVSILYLSLPPLVNIVLSGRAHRSFSTHISTLLENILYFGYEATLTIGSSRFYIKCPATHAQEYTHAELALRYVIHCLPLAVCVL